MKSVCSTAMHEYKSSIAIAFHCVEAFVVVMCWVASEAGSLSPLSSH